jgi:O-antigen/teichoic acid export membrane protein
MDDAAGAAVHSRVAHNTLLNLLGLAVPLAVAFFVMPVAARHLGPARFGLLGLAWAITEYLILFDLGLGRAIVKFVADALHRRPHELDEIVAVATASQVLAGCAGGVIFALLAPTIVRVGFHVPPAVSSEAVGMFRVVAVSLPAVLLLSLLRGILEGAQRFDLSNAIKMASSASSVAIPAIGAYNGASLPTIFWWVLLSRLIACSLYVGAISHALPGFSWKVPRDWGKLRELLSFGSWVLVSNVVSPLLVYFDRFALAAIAGVAAVGFYTAPYEGVTRLLLVAVSLAGSLLPALTSLESRADRARLTELGASSVRTLAVVMAPPLAVIFAFAPELLHLWMGATYADQASTALRVLAIGVFMNALAQPPFVSLYALDRPDLPAKFHLAELAIHVPLTLFLIRNFGITGAAASWTIRVTLDLCLLLIGSARCTGTSFASVAGGQVARTGGAVAALGGALFLAATLTSASLPLSALAALTAVAAFLVLGWNWILRDTERSAIARLVGAYTSRSRLISS